MKLFDMDNNTTAAKGDQ